MSKHSGALECINSNLVVKKSKLSPRLTNLIRTLKTKLRLYLERIKTYSNAKRKSKVKSNSAKINEFINSNQ